MITSIEHLPITETSYPFSSAERYCNLSSREYRETEYLCSGTANVYRSVGTKGDVEVAVPDVPYVNRLIVRAPEDPTKCSGNVVVEIINPTSFMEIERMWILGREQFLRNGDIYVGITSKPNTIAKLIEFNEERYSRLSWANPTPDKPFPFTEEDTVGLLPDIEISYETGLFWDMLTDLAWLLRSDDDKNPIRDYSRDCLCLTGWSQSACYLQRYVNSFSYRPDVARGGRVFDCYLTGGCVRSIIIPVNQYESVMPYHFSLATIKRMEEPFISVQTETENGKYDGLYTMRTDSDLPDYRFRYYEVAGASHDTMSSYVNYYQNDPDLVRINHLPEYLGQHEEGNDYPSEILYRAAYRNLFYWARTGVSPASCERIPVDAQAKNQTDAFGNTRGGLRTCLLNYPTGRYYSTSKIEPGQSPTEPLSDTDTLFGHQEAFSPAMLKELYGSLANYRTLCEKDTKEQIAKGFICSEDAGELVELAVALAAKRCLN